MHKMNLWNDSFKAIKCGSKTIEMRLNDEKRSLIKIGDEIEFINKKTNEVLICEVIGLYMNLADAIDSQEKKETTHHIIRESEWKKLIKRYSL